MTARAGCIIPSSNRMVEQEMLAAFPPGVKPHVTRLRMTGANRAPLDAVLPRIEDSMQEGRNGEERILDAMTRAGAPQATTTATAVRRAFDALGARKVVLITPYDQATTDHEAEFLHEAGYQVLRATGFALKGSDAYCAT